MNKIPIILYADDNENDIELTLEAFRECGLQNKIEVAKDGKEVLDYLKNEGKHEGKVKEKPVLILLDIKMPKLDGIEVLKIIKADEDLRTIPVVMLTSSSMEKDLYQSYKLGANAYVVKPIDFVEFMDSVKKIGAFWALVNKTV